MTSPLPIEIPYHETPLDYFERLLELDYPLLFDSGRPGSSAGRYDIFTAAPLYTIRYTGGLCDDSRKGSKPMDGQQLLDHLNQALGEIRKPLAGQDAGIPFAGGLAGFASYDLGRAWERLPSQAARDIDLPELLIGYFPWAGVIDHHERRAWLSFLDDCPQATREGVQHLLLGHPAANNKNKYLKINELSSKFNVDSYSKSVLRIKEYIKAGDCYQVNLSQRFSGSYEGDPWAAYLACRSSMMSPFSGYFKLDRRKYAENNAILSFSPERFIKLEDGHVLTQPIKGTSARRADPREDAEAALALQGSEKNRAENLMIVDLLRNDLGRSCEYGSVKTEKIFEIQSFSNVHHLVSHIAGRLRQGLTAFDLMRSAFPGGSITGAPKIRAMEIIEELEPQRRSIYCGSLFYVNTRGDMDSNIAIRTLLFLDGAAYCWGGGGVVSDSVPEQEYEESLVKIRKILDSIKSIKTNI